MSYFTWDMGSDVLDDWAARGVCSSCHVQLDLEDGCPDCDEKCQQCDEYMFTFDEPYHKVVNDEPMCPDCWLENDNPFERG
jgi:hypothetical protein